MDFNLDAALSKTGSFLAEGLITTSIVTSAGYAIGTLERMDPLQTSKAALIAGLAIHLFRTSVEYGINMNQRNKNLIYITGTTFGGAAGICALKNAEMISTVAAAILGTGLFVLNTVALILHSDYTYLYAD